MTEPLMDDLMSETDGIFIAVHLEALGCDKMSGLMDADDSGKTEKEDDDVENCT